MHVVWVYACGVYIVWRVGLLDSSVISIMLPVLIFLFFINSLDFLQIILETGLERKK